MAEWHSGRMVHGCTVRLVPCGVINGQFTRSCGRSIRLLRVCNVILVLASEVFLATMDTRTQKPKIHIVLPDAAQSPISQTSKPYSGIKHASLQNRELKVPLKGIFERQQFINSFLNELLIICILYIDSSFDYPFVL